MYRDAPGVIINGFGGDVTVSIGIMAAILGGIISMLSVYVWSFEPVNEPDETSSH